MTSIWGANVELAINDRFHVIRNSREAVAFLAQDPRSRRPRLRRLDRQAPAPVCEVREGPLAQAVHLRGGHPVAHALGHLALT